MSAHRSMSRRVLAVALLCLVCFIGNARAQQAPRGVDVYLAPLKVHGHHVRVGRPINITNRAGYDNQPAFTADGRAVLYTSIRDDGQADIYRYEIRSRTTSRLTTTPESEYSATMMPAARVSVIRVERDSAQRLWSFDLSGEDPRLVLERIKPVGYHAWIDTSTLALFVLGSPNSLQIADIATGEARVVANDIGRSLVVAPGKRAFSYLQRADSAWWLYRGTLDAAGRFVATRLARMPAGADYVVWTSAGDAITGKGSTLLRLNPAKDSAWSNVADLRGSGLDRISRLAISPDGRWLAFVAEPTVSSP